MKRSKAVLITVLIAALALVGTAGCSGKAKTGDGFSPSKGILDTGFFEGITALDHVELCEYVGIPIPNDVYEVSDESIQAEVNTILDQFASSKQVTDRAVVGGDTMNIDYVGRVDGVAFDGGSTEGKGTEVTIGVTSYIDDFLEQIIGHTPGESFDVEVTFPEDYAKEDLRGKDAVFAVTLNHIVEKTFPELTDKFVSDNLSSSYGWKTVAEMKTDIEGRLRQTDMDEYVRDYIVKNTTVSDLPEKLLEYQRASLIHYYQRYADSYGAKLEEFLASYLGVATVDELLVTAAEDTKEAATFHLIIQAIAEDAGISVTVDDVADYFVKQVGAEQYSEYARSYGMPYLKLVVLGQKVMDYLEDNAVVKQS
ncbi:MAG: trigger factor [Bacillota bacterium]